MTETSAHDSLDNKAAELLRLHRDPTLLTVVNVWDVISAKVVADTPGTAALATASHSIAASLGYEDGENIPLEEMIEAVRRIAEATTLPVTADLEGGYGDPAETVRRAIDVGVVGANIEDQMRPLAEAAANVAAIMDAAVAEGVPDFVLNARTDAFAKAGDRDRAEVLADAVERGKAFLDAGAPAGVRARTPRRGAGHHPGRGLRPAAAHRDRHPGRCRRSPGSRSSASRGSPTARCRSGSR